MTPSDTAHPEGENLSCPFCGSDRIDINEGGNSSWGRCRTCNAEGPVKPTYTEARAAWNTRPVARPQGEGDEQSDWLSLVAMVPDDEPLLDEADRACNRCRAKNPELDVEFCGDRRCPYKPQPRLVPADAPTPADLEWLRRVLGNDRNVGHCGEGTLERRHRESTDARIDRILSALSNQGKPSS